MSLKIYIDRLSQPSRAIELFLKVNKINYTPKIIKLFQGEHRSSDYAKINPFKLIPAMEHNGNIIIESVAILRYLCREHSVPDHWYPKDSLKQARIDEYLSWHHSGTRGKAMDYLRVKVLGPLFMGQESDEKTVEKAKAGMISMCDSINNIWLKEKPFINSSEISIADLLAATELETLVLVNYDSKVGRGNISAWIERVRGKTNPAYDELSQELNKSVKLIKSISKL